MHNLIGAARPWHYSLQLYNTLGLVSAFSTVLKLIFYQVTRMATIFSKVCMVYVWDSQVVMSLPHFQLDGYNFQDCKNFSFNYLQPYYNATKQVGMVSYSLDIRVLLG